MAPCQQHSSNTYHHYSLMVVFDRLIGRADRSPPIHTFPGVVTGETYVGDAAPAVPVPVFSLSAARLITSLYSHSVAEYSVFTDGCKKLGNNVCRSRTHLQLDTTKYLTKLTHCVLRTTIADIADVTGGGDLWIVTVAHWGLAPIVTVGLLGLLCKQRG